MTIVMLCVLLLLIIQDIQSRTISVYNLLALTICGIFLNLFSLESTLMGAGILLSISFYARFRLQKPIFECIGNGDILLLGLICAITPFDYVAGLVFLSGVLGSFWYLLLKTHQIPIGAGIGASYLTVNFIQLIF